ncbi:MAG: hypothetical protein AB7E30_09155 [Lawsonibacter sp.]
MAIAAVVTVLLLSGAAFAAWEPYSYVTMDVNPSIQYALNVFNRVLSITAVNEDAEPVVRVLNQENTSFRGLDDVIEMTIEQCRADGYLYQDDKDYVVLSVASVSNRRTDALAETLEDQSFGDGLISAEIVPSTIQALKEANREGTTPGKLAIIRRMQERTGDSQGLEAWIGTPVREILRIENAFSKTGSNALDGTQSQRPKDQDASSATGPAAKQGIAASNTDQPDHSGTKSNADASASSKTSPKDENTQQEELPKNEPGKKPDLCEDAAPEEVQQQSENAEPQNQGGQSAPDGSAGGSEEPNVQGSIKNVQANGASGNE